MPGLYRALSLLVLVAMGVSCTTAADCPGCSEEPDCPGCSEEPDCLGPLSSEESSLPACEVLPTLYEIDGYSNGGLVEVLAASVNEQRAQVSVRDAFGETLTLSFRTDHAPPALPALGPAQLSIEYAPCYGEGCDPGTFRLSGESGDWFEVGYARGLEDGPSQAHHFAVESPAGASGCDDGDPDTRPAALRVHGDDGDVTLAPGEAARVVIGGREWQAVAGSAFRDAFYWPEGPCADCPEPGCHTTTTASAVLYVLP